jgi:hypothetical protein
MLPETAATVRRVTGFGVVVVGVVVVVVGETDVYAADVDTVPTVTVSVNVPAVSGFASPVRLSAGKTAGALDLNTGRSLVENEMTEPDLS